MGKILINFYKNNQNLTSDFKYFKALNDIERILKYISDELNKNLSMSLFVCDSIEIKKLNKIHRNKDSVTDVLSFPHNENEDDYLYIGDVFINEDILEIQATEINSDSETEIKFLAMHGILHLIGYDHLNISDEEKMTSKQREIFINLGIRDW